MIFGQFDMTLSAIFTAIDHSTIRTNKHKIACFARRQHTVASAGHRRLACVISTQVSWLLARILGPKLLTAPTRQVTITSTLPASHILLRRNSVYSITLISSPVLLFSTVSESPPVVGFGT